MGWLALEVSCSVQLDWRFNVETFIILFQIVMLGGSCLSNATHNLILGEELEWCRGLADPCQEW
jgi:hypothetical protein